MTSGAVMTLKDSAFNNIVGNLYRACSQHFLLFPQCFYLVSRIIVLMRFQLFSDNSFILHKTNLFFLVNGLSYQLFFYDKELLFERGAYVLTPVTPRNPRKLVCAKFFCYWSVICMSKY